MGERTSFQMKAWYILATLPMSIPWNIFAASSGDPAPASPPEEERRSERLVKEETPEEGGRKGGREGGRSKTVVKEEEEGGREGGEGKWLT